MSSYFKNILDSYRVIAFDEESESVLFEAYGEICCDINGEAFNIDNIYDFWDAVNFFRGETFEE